MRSRIFRTGGRREPNGSEAGRFLLFLLVGGLNTLVGYGCFALLVLAGTGPTASLVGATAFGILFNFKSTGSIVFGRGEPRLLPRFVAVYLLQFLANLGAMHALASHGVPPLAAEAILLPLLAVASFLMMRRFVFATGLAAKDAHA